MENPNHILPNTNSGLVTAVRDARLDIYRGAAIFLVALGHVVQSRTENFDESLLFKAIYVFHMPLFFYICGMVYALSSKRGNQSERLTQSIGKRARQLLLPFLAWFVFRSYPFADSTVVAKFVALYRSPDEGLWFLWVLFWATVLADIAGFIYKKIRFSFAAICILVFCGIVVASLNIYVLGIGLLALYFPFFVLGILHTAIVKPVQRYKKILYPAAVIGFAILLLSWRRNVVFPKTLEFLSSLGIPHFNGLSEIFAILGNVVNAAVALPGIITFFAICSLLLAQESAYANKIKELLVFLGTRTLGIYAIHFYFTGAHFVGSFLLDVVFCAIAAIAISILIIDYLIKPLPLLSILLLGRKS